MFMISYKVPDSDVQDELARLKRRIPHEHISTKCLPEFTPEEEACLAQWAAAETEETKRRAEQAGS